MAASREVFVGRCLVGGDALGEVLSSDVPLSFMGGVDPATGRVVDAHHPLRGEHVGGRVLAIPSGRGSCAGSLVILELLLAGTAPAALVFEHDETILPVGVVIADELFGLSIPVVQLDAPEFAVLRGTTGRVQVVDGAVGPVGRVVGRALRTATAEQPAVDLTKEDRRMLAGDVGEAARVAMRVVLRAAAIERVTELVDVELAHADGVFYTGPASLAFATRLRELGARVRVPTTMNALCVDRRRWRTQGVPAELGLPSDELADAYVAMGASPSYTCAPYCLDRRPRPGQQVAWGESNAVVYANSVLGARTAKYPDLLDLLVAVTGRAPLTGPHRSLGRRATVHVHVDAPPDPDDAFFATLGYHVGLLAPHDIPVLSGLAGAGVTDDDLKAFGAAFATTSAAPMFHVVGVTPEAASLEDACGGSAPGEPLVVDCSGLAGTWRELSTATDTRVDLVALGNPHFSLTELGRLAVLVEGRSKAPGVDLMITCSRDVQGRAEVLGYVDQIRRFGGTVVNDTCWCLVAEPVVPSASRTIATTSGKYAHYGPGSGSAGRTFHLRGLADCVDAACVGSFADPLPPWLRAAEHGAATERTEP